MLHVNNTFSIFSKAIYPSFPFELNCGNEATTNALVVRTENSPSVTEQSGKIILSIFVFTTCTLYFVGVYIFIKCTVWPQNIKLFIYVQLYFKYMFIPNFGSGNIFTVNRFKRNFQVDSIKHEAFFHVKS